MEPLEYLKILQRRFTVVALAPALAILAAFATTFVTPSSVASGPFRATHTFYRDVLSEDDSTGLPNLETIALFATTGEIPRRVAQRLGRPPEQGPLTARDVSVDADAELGVLRITAEGTAPAPTAELADLFAEQIVTYLGEQQSASRQRAIDATAAAAAADQRRIAEVDAELARTVPSSTQRELLLADRQATIDQYAAAVGTLRELESRLANPVGLVTLETASAAPMDGGVGPSISATGRLAVAGIVGLFLGVALALVLERVDTRIRTGRAAERAFGLPVLAEVPHSRRSTRRAWGLVAMARPMSPEAEAYRKLRVALQLMPRWVTSTRETVLSGAAASGPVQRNGNDPQVVLVTSPLGNEGKSLTTANLAATFAEIGKRVLVLDCDFRRADQHEMFSIERAPGMSDFLALGDEEASLRTLAQTALVPRLQVVPAGSVVPNPGRLLGGDVDLIAATRAIADVVLIDCGALLSVNDAVALVPQVDAVVLIARSGHTTDEAAHEAGELLARVKAPTLGVVLTDVPTKLIERKPSRGEVRAQRAGPDPAGPHEAGSRRAQLRERWRESRPGQRRAVHR